MVKLNSICILCNIFEDKVETSDSINSVRETVCLRNRTSGVEFSEKQYTYSEHKSIELIRRAFDLAPNAACKLRDC